MADAVNEFGRTVVSRGVVGKPERAPAPDGLSPLLYRDNAFGQLGDGTALERPFAVEALVSGKVSTEPQAIAQAFYDWYLTATQSGPGTFTGEPTSPLNSSMPITANPGRTTPCCAVRTCRIGPAPARRRSTAPAPA
jgi:hypothetical protein